MAGSRREIYSLVYEELVKVNVIISLMILSLEEVDHIAHLAQLKLSQDEKGLYRQQLSAILDYMEMLNTADTSDISPILMMLRPSVQLSGPASSVLPSRGVLREDRTKVGLSTDQLLRNSPSVKDKQFKVPPVLEDN